MKIRRRGEAPIKEEGVSALQKVDVHTEIKTEETRPNVLSKQATAKASEAQKNNPMHGVKLADMLAFLEKKYGWGEMGRRINIRCFKFEPSIKSSLHFLRRTPWARKKVEEWFIEEEKKHPFGYIPKK